MRAILLGFLGLACSVAGAESWPDPDWRVDPSAADWRSVDDYAFAPRPQGREGIRTDALLIIRDGRIVHERYLAPTRADTPHLTWSISKSVLATVLGVAYGEKRFALDDSATRYYPVLAHHPQLRVVDLLHWSSGLAWQEDYEYAPVKSSVVAMLYTRGREDMAAYAASKPAGSVPGERFGYSSGDSNLLSAALRGMVGGALYPGYPWQALFNPLGITSAVWERDGAGNFIGSSYLYLSARDLGRIGLLMLREGRWRDRHVLPGDWVAFNRALFSRAQPHKGEPNPGGHWWLNQALLGADRPWPDAPADTYAALGHWGQALYIVPTRKLVIVRYADDRDTRYQHNELLKRVLAALPPEAP